MNPDQSIEVIQPKPWRCKRCGAVLGAVTHDADHSIVLVVFRLALSEREFSGMILGGSVNESVGGVTLMEGTVRCNRCMRIKRWHRDTQSI